MVCTRSMVTQEETKGPAWGWLTEQGQQDTWLMGSWHWRGERGDRTKEHSGAEKVDPGHWLSTHCRAEMMLVDCPLPRDTQVAHTVYRKYFIVALC